MISTQHILPCPTGGNLEAFTTFSCVQLYGKDLGHVLVMLYKDNTKNLGHLEMSAHFPKNMLQV